MTDKSLVVELNYADKAILNAMAVMDEFQRTEWCRRNEKDGFTGLRYHERGALLEEYSSCLNA